MKYFVTVAGQEFEIEVDGERVVVDGREIAVTLTPVAGTPLRLLGADGRSYAVPLHPAGRGAWTVTWLGERHEVEVVDERTRHIRSLTAATGGRAAAGALRAPMPGLVVRVEVEAGQEVRAGQPVVVLEAMKMENELRAPAPGTVAAVRARPGQPVEKGEVLVEFAVP